MSIICCRDDDDDIRYHTMAMDNGRAMSNGWTMVADG